MTGGFGLVETLHNDLLQRQFLCVEGRRPESFIGQHGRLADYARRGKMNMRSVQLTAGLSDEVVDACFGAVRLDRRFSFVQRLPQSAALGTAVGDAIETSLTGSISQTSSEFTTLINLFITLLDGLIDEVPELFDAERERVWELLEASSALWRLEMDAGDLGRATHPVVAAIYLLLFDGARRLRASPHIQVDSAMRNRFVIAVERALAAEYASRPVQKIGSLMSPSGRISLLERKSENALWVSALVPICMNGWPEWLSPADYESIARALGRYFGWLDDLSDLFVDVAHGCWNSVLIEIFRCRKAPTGTSIGLWQSAVVSAIAFDDVSSHLLGIGMALYDDVVDQLEVLTCDCRPVLNLVADATTSWLVQSN